MWTGSEEILAVYKEERERTGEAGGVCWLLLGACVCGHCGDARGSESPCLDAGAGYTGHFNIPYLGVLTSCA